MLKYACYSEHTFVTKGHSERRAAEEMTHPVPEPFWTHPYKHPGCSDMHAKLLKSGQGEKEYFLTRCQVV